MLPPLTVAGFLLSSLKKSFIPDSRQSGSGDAEFDCNILPRKALDLCRQQLMAEAPPLHLRLRPEIATFQAATSSFIRLVALPIAACANISLPQIPADSTRYNFYTMEQFTCQFTTAQMPDQKRTARLFEEILQCGGICKLARVRNRLYSCSTTLRRPL